MPSRRRPHADRDREVPDPAATAPLLLDGPWDAALLRVCPASCLDELVITRRTSSPPSPRIHRGRRGPIENQTFGSNRSPGRIGLERWRPTQPPRRPAPRSRESSGRSPDRGLDRPLGRGRQPRPHPGIARPFANRSRAAEGGVDLFVFEPRSPRLLLSHRGGATSLRPAVIAQMTFGEDWRPTTEDAEAAARALVMARGRRRGQLRLRPLVCLEALALTGPPTATVARSIVPTLDCPSESRRLRLRSGRSTSARWCRRCWAGARIVAAAAARRRSTRRRCGRIDASPTRPGGRIVAARLRPRRCCRRRVRLRDPGGGSRRGRTGTHGSKPGVTTPLPRGWPASSRWLVRDPRRDRPRAPYVSTGTSRPPPAQGSGVDA